MTDKMNGENHSLVRLFLKSGFMKELDLTKGSVLKTLLQFAVPFWLRICFKLFMAEPICL